jgi:hypothetical protein
MPSRNLQTTCRHVVGKLQPYHLRHIHPCAQAITRMHRKIRCVFNPFCAVTQKVSKKRRNILRSCRIVYFVCAHQSAPTSLRPVHSRHS